jgi:CDP-paratose 2-epimerase
MSGGVTLVTGGAGFIGCNVADRLLSEGTPVRLFDNLARPGVERNLEWLRARHGARLQVTLADLRDRATLADAVRGVDRVFHFAAQVAVTTSIADPLDDFSVNAQGTLNLLEALRALPSPPPLVYTSTNKVYGALDDVPLTCDGNRHQPESAELRLQGLSEARLLDFHSPYGCSKGAADQYVRDYARTFGMPTVVLRMSCIYGPHQYGTEDQGWVAHFLIRALEGGRITVFGDGRQVRDILYVDDLVDAALLAAAQAKRLAGQAFNIGGGPRNAVSLLDLIERIARMQGHRPEVAFGDWRGGDQRWYVSDVRRFERATGWSPKVAASDGLARLHAWLAAHATTDTPTPAPAEAPPALLAPTSGALR